MGELMIDMAEYGWFPRSLSSEEEEYDDDDDLADDTDINCYANN